MRNASLKTRIFAAFAVALTALALFGFRGGLTTTYEGIAATRAVLTWSVQGTLKQAQCRTGHIARDDITRLKVIYGNFSNSEAAVGASSPITLGVEYPPGSETRILWGGATSGTIPDGGILASDYVTISIPKGAQFWLRPYVTNTVGVSFAVDQQDNANMGDACNAGASGISDQSMGGAITNAFTNLTLSPIAIIAPITVPSGCIIGDSIGLGVNDTFNNASGDIGAIARSIGPSFGYSKLALSGESASTFVSNSTQRRKVFPYCSDKFVQYGTNEIAGGAAALQANLTTIYGFAGNPTSRTYQTTILPRTDSVDGWTTPGGQTVISSESQRVIFNDALRAGSFGPGGGYIDLASAVETALDSGLWKSSPSVYTGDGTHPSAFGYTQIQSSGVVRIR